MLGRVLFGLVLAFVGLLYIVAATWAVFGKQTAGSQGFLEGNLFGALLFLVVGIAAAVASVNLLREKRR